MNKNTDESSCVCQLQNCQLFLENPITLVCGSTICKEHVEKYDQSDRFKCDICQKEHEVPNDGFKVNRSMQNLITIFLKLNEYRKHAQNSLDKLTQLVQSFDSIRPEDYIYDYFAMIRNQIDTHREQLVKHINDKSDELIEILKEKEEKCKLNAKKLNKVFLNATNNELTEWKHQLRVPEINKEQIMNLTSRMKQYIELTQYEIRKYKFNLKMNTEIEFKPIDDSCFGELNEIRIHVDLADKCGILSKNLIGHPNSLTCFKTIQNESNILISGSEDVLIKIWNLNTCECLKTLDEHKSSIANIITYSNYSKFISASRGGTIKIWDLSSYLCLNTIHCETGISNISLISENTLASSSDNGFIYIYNLDQAELIEKFEAHSNAITSLINNDSVLISSSTDAKIKLWNLNTYELLNELNDHKLKVNCLSFTYDKKLFLSGSDDETVKIWNLDSTICLDTIEFKNSINKLKFLTKNLIAIGSKFDIFIYDLTKKVQLRQILQPHNANIINCIDITSNGFLVTSSTGDNTIKLWSMLNNFKELDD